MRRTKGRGVFIFCCVAPAIVLFIIFMIIPTIDVFRMSLYKWGGYTANKTFVGLKNFTANEPFFQGHFPQEPVMPGVLIVEAMAQTGGLLVLNSVDEPERYSTYFMKIDNVKFRQKVVPGDTLIFHLSMITEVRRGCAYMKGYAFVGEKIVAEAEFMAQIIKNK